MYSLDKLQQMFPSPNSNSKMLVSRLVVQESYTARPAIPDKTIDTFSYNT